MRLLPHHRPNDRITRFPVAGPGFVHLHVHSSYSLLEGAIAISAAFLPAEVVFDL